MSNSGIKTPNFPLGISIGEFIGHEIVGGTRSTRRYSRAQVLGTLDALTAGVQAGGGVTFSTLAQANTSLNYAANQMAWVVQDATPTNNGVYQKAGASGTGSWARLADLPYSFYRAVNEGAGTANAIAATNGYPMANKDALIVFNVTATNTSDTVTLSLNGGTPLTIKTAAGNDPAVGGFTSGMMLAGYIDGAEFRLLSDQASAAIQAAAEAAQAAAEAARDVATGAMSTFLENLFPTKAVAAAYSPSAAPDELWVGGVAVVGDTSIILYKKNGTTTGDLVITLSDGTTFVGYDVAGPVINAAGCGLSPSATGAVNLAALKKAVSLCPVGGTVWVPPLSGTCTVDTSGGLSNAVLIDKTITFRIDGDLKANYAVREANPAFMFKITGDDVVVRGSGQIEGDGTTFSNGLDGNNVVYPGLVYITGKRLSWRGVNIVKPPMMGIYLAAATDCDLQNFNVIGGHVGYETSTIIDPSDPNFGTVNPAYDGSYNVGIVMSGGSGHMCRGIRFLPGADGGAVIQGFFGAGDLGSVQKCTISECYAEDPWEKLFYMYGDGHILVDNRVLGTWGGSYQSSCHTDAFRIMGSDCLLEGNIANNVQGGIQSLNGSRNQIAGNRIIACVGVAINVEQQAGEPSISLTSVRGNTVVFQGSYSVAADAGIRVYSADADILFIDVSGNFVFAYGKGTNAAIDVSAGTGINVYQPTLNANTIVDYGNAIRISRSVTAKVSQTVLRVGTGIGIAINASDGAEVSGTTGTSVGTWALSQSSSSNVRFINNNTRGAANIGVAGLSFGVSGNYGRNNQYTDKPLIGSATLAANATTTVTHGGVAPEAIINLLGGDGSFQTLVDASGFYTSPNFSHFSVVRASGAAPAGTETFHYEVIQ